MNQAPTADVTVRPPLGSRRGIAVGIAMSALLHVLLIFGYRISVPNPGPPGPPTEAMTVWLRPPPPPVPPVKPMDSPPPKAVAKVEPPHKKNKEEEPLAAKSSPPAAPSTPPVQAALPPQAIAVPGPASQPADPLHPELAPKKFDMEAALKTARKVANERDPARANLPVGQLDTHPLYPEETDTKLARDIKSAKRPDCKDGGSAGLLTPLIWLLDKKDSGCKW